MLCGDKNENEEIIEENYPKFSLIYNKYNAKSLVAIKHP
jgi:hypothetical protein